MPKTVHITDEEIAYIEKYAPSHPVAGFVHMAIRNELDRLRAEQSNNMNGSEVFS